MIASSLVCRRAPVVAVCLVLIAESPLPAQNRELPESVRLALVRYAAIESLAVTWTQTAEATPLGRKKVAADVLDKIVSNGSFVQQLAFRNGRIYVRRETQEGSSWPPRTEEIAFDRELFYAAQNLFYVSDLRNREPKDWPYLHKWLPRNDGPEASYFRDDYFRASGVRLPTRIKELLLSWHPQAELLALLAEGGQIEAIGSASLDGHLLFRVQASSLVPKPNLGMRNEQGTREKPLYRYDFYFDPEYGYAIRRLEVRDEAGRLLTRSDCTGFEQLSGWSVWLPRLCRVAVHTWAGVQEERKSIFNIFASPLYIKNIRVNAFDVKLWPDDRFQLKPTMPGVYVNDASFPEIKGMDGVFYQVPADPQRLNEVIAVRRALYQGWRGADKRSRPLRALFLVLNGMGLVSLAVYVIVRQYKARGQHVVLQGTRETREEGE